MQDKQKSRIPHGPRNGEKVTRNWARRTFMKSRKHKPEQIIKKLREADAMLAAGKTIGQVAQSLEISEQTFHRWRNQ
tara:strand:+ start:1279 stop:1509 length:231 start_codon:yes stop_codon:yes gene_type:complete